MQQRKLGTYLFSNFCLHSTAIPYFIFKEDFIFIIIIIFTFFYSGSVEELTHSRELGGAVTQGCTRISLYSKALNGQNGTNKSLSSLLLRPGYADISTGARQSPPDAQKHLLPSRMWRISLHRRKCYRKCV